MSTTEETYEQARRRVLEERLDGLGGFEQALRDAVVSVDEIKSQYEACALGRQIEKDRSRTWMVGSEILPEEAKEILRKYDRRPGHLWSHYSVHIVYPPIGGQSGGGGGNVRIIVVPYWGDPDGHYIAIEVGCRHEIVSTNLGRCYNKYSCSKCEFSYTVDSGD